MYMAKNKFYVVWKGLNPGVYDNWNACKMQVEGQDGAKYKSFETREEAYAVDAACSGNPGLMEYRGVYTATKQELFRIGPYEQGTNNIGEFLALVHGLAFLKQKKSSLPIYSDSRNAIMWVQKKKCKTLLEREPRNEVIFNLIERAEKWLLENEYTTSILKWETSEWGEIPADFGRK
jgi:ribonuclease HI